MVVFPAGGRPWMFRLFFCLSLFCPSKLVFHSLVDHWLLFCCLFNVDSWTSKGATFWSAKKEIKNRFRLIIPCVVKSERSRDLLFGGTEEIMKKRKLSSKNFLLATQDSYEYSHVYFYLLLIFTFYYLILVYCSVPVFHTHKHSNITPRGPVTIAGTSKFFLRFTSEYEPTRDKVLQVTCNNTSSACPWDKKS